MRHHPELIFMQASLSFTFPWAAYFTSEAMELSGIVTILFCGMIMAVYTRYNFSKDARILTAQAYKCVAMVAETYVFVYLGMAVFTFPIFNATTWMLVVFALIACFIGRLHIYVGSWITNCFRSDTPAAGELPKISATYMFMMWFSGLRGGVAFALASVSFASRDFSDDCGGLSPEDKAASSYCGHAGMSDSLAILQTTLIIATFTIFVFGGAITELAVAGGVLNKKVSEPPSSLPVPLFPPHCPCHSSLLTARATLPSSLPVPLSLLTVPIHDVPVAGPRRAGRGSRRRRVRRVRAREPHFQRPCHPLRQGQDALPRRRREELPGGGHERRAGHPEA